MGDELFRWEGWEAQAEIKEEAAKPSVILLGKRIRKMGKAV